MLCGNKDQKVSVRIANCRVSTQFWIFRIDSKRRCSIRTVSNDSFHREQPVPCTSPNKATIAFLISCLKQSFVGLFRHTLNTPVSALSILSRWFCHHPSYSSRLHMTVRIDYPGNKSGLHYNYTHPLLDFADRAIAFTLLVLNESLKSRIHTIGVYDM